MASSSFWLISVIRVVQYVLRSKFNDPGADEDEDRIAAGESFIGRVWGFSGREQKLLNGIAEPLNNIAYEDDLSLLCLR
jgi:hypothetical protein